MDNDNDDDIIESIEKLDSELHSGRVDKTDGFRRLGHIKSLAGLARAGLEDSLRAYVLAVVEGSESVKDLQAKNLDALWASVAGSGFPSEKAGFAVLVQLGEALRIHARDLDISSPTDALQKTRDRLEQSVRCFDVGIELSQGQSAARRAWVHGHRGAAYTTLFWIANSLNNDPAEKKKLFETAQSSFREAVKLDSKYAWALQFEAFLLTIRGQHEDFQAATALLSQANTAGAVNTTSLNRSLAILNFNMVDTKAPTDTQRLKTSIAHGLAAMRADTEECPAAFFVAASMALLAKSDDSAKHVYQQTVASAIQSARTRATNIISQAAASLVGLAAVETALCGSCQVKEAQPYRQWLELAKQIPPDLETRVVFDHAVRQLRALVPAGGDLAKELDEFLDAFQANNRAGAS